jgi:hypothetical protein
MDAQTRPRLRNKAPATLAAGALPNLISRATFSLRASGAYRPMTCYCTTQRWLAQFCGLSACDSMGAKYGSDV